MVRYLQQHMEAEVLREIANNLEQTELLQRELSILKSQKTCSHKESEETDCDSYTLYTCKECKFELYMGVELDG